MPKFGRIQNNIVMEIIIADELPAFHPEVAAMFQVIPDDVQVNWTFDGTNYSAPIEVIPIPDPIDQLKTLFKSLSIEERVAFSPVRTQVLDALNDNDFELALALINGVQAPTDLQPTKNQMVQLIQDME